ncbi:MAG: hypothetical protein ABII79_08290 [bacterium]
MSHSYVKSKRFLLPTLLWLLFVVGSVTLLQTGKSKYHTLAGQLFQWDGQHYLTIARDGYEKFPCPWNDENICGNIGWFPFYPILGRMVQQVVGLLGGDTRLAMIAAGWLALWLALLVMYRLVERRFGSRSALLSLVAILLFPTSFYFLTGFPYSVYLLLSVLVMYFLDREKFLPVAILTGLLAVTYPSGVVIGLPVLYILVTRWRELTANHRLTLFLALAGIALALFLYCGYYWWRFDDFFLYQRFQAQSYYAHHLTLPLLPIANSLIEQPWQDPEFVMLLFIVVAVVVFYTRRIPVAWQLYLFGVLLFTPTFGTTTCYYRHIVVAWPLFVMIGVSIDSGRRRWLWVPYAVISVCLMVMVFLRYFKAGQLM